MPSAKILIVEDDEVVAADLRRLLEEFGYSVCGALRFAETAAAEAAALKPDVVLMDVVLQGQMDGITAAAQIKSSANSPVIYLTSHADDETLARAQVTEPYGYLVKPFSKPQLKAAIEMTLHRRRIAAYNHPDHAAESRVPVKVAVAGSSASDYLRTVKFFDKVPDEQLELLSSTCRFEEVAAHKIITMEGEEDAPPFLVFSGRVAMSKMSPDGKELIVELVTPKDVFGLVAALETAPASLTSRAQAASKILWVPRTSFLSLLDKNPELYAALSRFIADRLQKSHEQARALAHDEVQRRIATTLFSLATRLCDISNSRVISMPLTRQELASLAGNTIETTIRVTKEMERQGILSLKQRGKIDILDIKALKNTAGLA